MTVPHLHHLMYRAEAEMKLAQQEDHEAEVPELPLGSGFLGSGFVLFLVGLPNALVALAMRKVFKA
jgi:hypothetical protein